MVGYGLDYAERYRNLKDVCVLSLPRNNSWLEKVLTVRDLESVGESGELVVAPGTMVAAPLARDEAEARGITIRFEAPKPSDPAGASAAHTRAIAISTVAEIDSKRN